VYGCLQTLFKLHPAYDGVLADILRRDPKGIVIVPRGAAPHWERMVAARFAAAHGDVAGRLRFIDRVPRDQFRALNLACDVTLAPLPFGAGDTSLIAFSLGVPVVTMPTAHLRGRFTHAMYGVMGIDDCVATTPAEYVDIAARLANDDAHHRDLRQKILDRSGRLFENEAGVTELADWLMRVMPR
jgi:predicted O-linked N-acetylglucosamine transferase (SPINDLY family)